MLLLRLVPVFTCLLGAPFVLNCYSAAAFILFGYYYMVCKIVADGSMITAVDLKFFFPTTVRSYTITALNNYFLLLLSANN